jgi:hypothetical protein
MGSLILSKVFFLKSYWFTISCNCFLCAIVIAKFPFFRERFDN